MTYVTQQMEVFRAGHDKITLAMLLSNMTEVLWDDVDAVRMHVYAPEAAVPVEVTAEYIAEENVIYYDYNDADFPLVSGIYRVVGVVEFDGGRIAKSKHLLRFRVQTETADILD